MSDSTKAVFISYASQDVAAALRICAALHAAGVEVWFDQDALVGGDAWDAKIRGQIGACALFVPVISANTQERQEGYFRLEWHLAEQRSLLIAKGRPFIVPVSIDATSERGALVPEAFTAVQWTKLPGGEASAAFVARVQKLLGGPEAAGGASRPDVLAESRHKAAPTVRSSSRRWLVPTIISLAALVAFAFWQPWKKSAAPPPAAAQPPMDLSAAGSAKADKSIAVLPFANLSDDKDNTAFFSDGMHEDILTTLANIPELRVISRTSVMEYRGTTKKISQIARELGVAYILEGSVRRAGNQIRLTGQLIRADKDEHLWAKSYDRELTPKEMFSIQAALATEIAGALQAAISPAAKKLVERRPTENLAAYDLYLQARSLSRGLQTMRDRVKFLQEAVKLDPNFAEAWGALAAAHSSLIVFHVDNSPERFAQADAAIARAVRLAPDAPEVMLAFGAYARNAYGDLARSVAQLEKVIQLQPNNAEAYMQLFFTRGRQGRWSEALAHVRKAAEFDLGNLPNLRTALFEGRRWDEGLAVHRRIIVLSEEVSASGRRDSARFSFAATGSTKEFDDLAAQLTSAERESGNFNLSLKERAIIKDDFPKWKRLDALLPSEESNRRSPTRAIAAALVYAAHGDTVGARALLGSQLATVRAALEREPANVGLWESLARMEAILGEKEAALRALSRTAEAVSGSPDNAPDTRIHFNRAVIHALTGDKAKAVAELAEALRLPTSRSVLTLSNIPLSVHTLRIDPAFANLRGDPAFEKLLKDPKNHAPLF
ncbi:MAG: TIR domain-containing protein [Opitutus sp.]|nr:TIR domain-containing protein [Opitutus sp.]